MEKIRDFFQEKLLLLPVRFQLLLVAGIVMLATSGVFLFLLQGNQAIEKTEEADFLVAKEENQEEKSDESEIVKETVESQSLFVDVKGAVIKEGVYECQNGQRVQDALEKAGGASKQADLKTVNLSQKLTDEMVVYIPEIGEEAASLGVLGVQGDIRAVTAEANGKVSLNQATAQVLETLPGIGPKKAESIIAFRDKQGGFQRVEQLKDVDGIGDKIFEQIEPLVVP